MAIFNGTAGNDIFAGSAGPDELRGLGENDTNNVDIQGDLTFEFPNDGNDTVIASVGYYLWPYIETLQLKAGAGNIFGVGNDQGCGIIGNEGNNLLIGGAGNDGIYGGLGNDRLYGEDGSDSLVGDLDDGSANGGNDVLSGGAGNDYLRGEAGDDWLDGGSGNDYLNAGAGTNVAIGGDGNDRFDGLGADSASATPSSLYGGAGDDLYWLFQWDFAADVVLENAGEGRDVVRYFGHDGYYLTPNVEALGLERDGGGLQARFGVGNAGDNIIIGNEIDNLLLGGAGNDTISGWIGNDVMFGQNGSDTFYFYTLGEGQDVIGDFDVAQDKLHFGPSAQNSVFASFAQAQSHFVQVGNDGAIDLGFGNLIVLQNVNMANLTADNFIFDQIVLTL